MDGTLIESLGVWAECDRKFVNNLGFEYDSSISYNMKSLHYASACEYLRERFCPELTYDEVSDRIMKLVEYSYLNEIPLKPFAEEFLHKQFLKGVKMCVATSNNKPLAEKALKKLGIMKYLRFILTSDEVGVGKESPEIFTAAAHRLECEISDTLVFEDSCHAVEAASRAGFFTVGVYDGKYSEDYELLKSAADMTIESYERLDEILWE